MKAAAGAGFELTVEPADTLRVRGALDFATAAAAWPAFETAARRQGVARLDLSGVRRSDSAGLACVLAVLAAAARSGHALQVAGMPAGMRALAQVCGVEPLVAGALPAA